MKLSEISVGSHRRKVASYFDTIQGGFIGFRVESDCTHSANIVSHVNRYM